MSTQTDQHAPLQGWKYRLVIDTTFFAFLLSIIADALLSIFSIDYRLFYDAYILSIGRIFKLYFCYC